MYKKQDVQLEITHERIFVWLDVISAVYNSGYYVRSMNGNSLLFTVDYIIEGLWLTHGIRC